MTDKYPIELNIKLDIDNKKATINITRNDIKQSSPYDIKTFLYNKLQDNSNSSNLLDFDNWETEIIQKPKENNQSDLIMSIDNDSTVISYTYNNIFVLKNYYSPIKYPFKIISFEFSTEDYEKFNILSFQLEDKTNTMMSNNFINNFFKKNLVSSCVFTNQDEITEIILFGKILKYAIDNDLKYIILLKDYYRPSSDTIKILENTNKLYCNKHTQKIIIHSVKSKIIASDIKLIIIPNYYYQYLYDLVLEGNKSIIKIFDQLINKFTNKISLCNNNIFEIK